MQRIILNDHITMNQAVTPDEGQPICDMIQSSLQKGEPIILDFKDIELMTTAFLNIAIGSLYKNHSSEDLKKLLKLENLSAEDAIRIKRVTDNAKLFYSNPTKFNQSVEEAIHGKD